MRKDGAQQVVKLHRGRLRLRGAIGLQAVAVKERALCLLPHPPHGGRRAVRVQLRGVGGEGPGPSRSRRRRGLRSKRRASR